MRNLAVLDQESKLPEAAAVKYIAACQMAPGLRPLVIECGQFLIQSGQARQWLTLLKTLPAEIQEHARVRLLEAQAELNEGNLEAVEKFFASHPVLADMREGEVALSDLWVAYHARRLNIQEPLPKNGDLAKRILQEFPIPYELDFRQKTS
jgi:thioredoxin-like negative regulator of GroEL